MDLSEQYKDLTEKIEKNLPLTAMPIRELAQIFSKQWGPNNIKNRINHNECS